ncbi:MAG TPA: hypothetical protein VFA76_09140 [Terriglobales bacterium]|nr:hypothetical protein [Terriglobales bacterium]
MSSVKWRLRAGASLAIGAASTVLCWGLMHHFNQGAADFSYAVREANELLHGRNPYALFPYESYPITAAIFAIPFVWFKPEVGGAVFFGISSALLAWGLTRYSYTRLLVFLAYPYWAAMLTVQWAPLVMASALLPWLLPVTTAKPQLGAPIFLTRLNTRGAIGCVVVVLASLALMPTWPLEWWAKVGHHPHYVPLLALPGPVLLLALWRQNEDSQLLLLSALTPQHWFYDSFILWLIPKTRQEILATVCLSWGAGIWRWFRTPTSWQEVGSWAVLWIYIPMLSLLLLRRAVHPSRLAS